MEKTSTGQYSTDVEKLTELAGEHIVIDSILEHRKFSKLKSTYVDALPQMINEKQAVFIPILIRREQPQAG